MNLPFALLAIGVFTTYRQSTIANAMLSSDNSSSAEDTVHVIVECSMDDAKEKKIQQLGTVKHKLPMINSYVVEVPKKHVDKIHSLIGTQAVHQDTRITAQMNIARRVVRADTVAKQGYTGKGIGIAILDTGIAPIEDFTKPSNRIVAFKDFVNGKTAAYDDNGHGSHVAGIAGGNGTLSQGKYTGIAPGCNLIGVKILDKEGKGNTSHVLAGIQWVIDNKSRYNIRVANLSIGTTDGGGSDPLIKAVNAAWDAGIVVTVAAGNNGPNGSTITSPGISKKVITVGASDDQNTVEIWGDKLVNFSGRGPTKDCVIKPDIIAPGANIVSCLTPTPYVDPKHPDSLKIVANNYLQLSGTSMSTPIVAGSVALLLQKYPHLRPDDVKYLLKESTNTLNYPRNQQGWGLLDTEKLLSKEGKHVR